MVYLRRGYRKSILRIVGKSIREDTGERVNTIGEETSLCTLLIANWTIGRWRCQPTLERACRLAHSNQLPDCLRRSL